MLAWAEAAAGCRGDRLTGARRMTRLLAKAEALREEIGVTWAPHEEQEYRPALASARALLGQETFTAASSEGRAMTLDQAISLALPERSG